MKIIVTSTGKQLSSPFDLRFGRAAYLCLYDEKTGEINFIENKNAETNAGVGIQTAEKMAELGVGKVISGDFGPKAKSLLDKFNIQMVVLQNGNNTIQDIINKLKV
ncbi:hypothetical protein MNBD_IGNAVI01-2104 [hydrothermal vent metagenome]|uniref:Dinitrogenase iron-molybdenum cofactor biosynthesis domain-containing protein n=1 Tax=hydrothermal vent metagenome TaxID=652676 RepID=A0A3B1CDR4_9ZZZZ